jgi:hypothetical protein
LDKGIWRCFGCGCQGNALDFIIACEGLDSSNGADVRKAALLAQKKFLGKKEHAKPAPTVSEKPPSAPPSSPSAESPSVRINAPLDFRLRTLDAKHQWFKEHGYDTKTVEHFGLGVCNRGKLSGCVAIPLTVNQKLIGYAGRLLDEQTVSAENPLYRFPQSRIYEGVRHEFSREVFVYASPDITTGVKRLFIVGDIEAVWLLWQHGYQNTVSTMGTFCQGQAEAIRSVLAANGVAEVITADNDGGRDYARQISEALMPHCAVRWRKLLSGENLTELTALSLHTLLGAPTG